LTILKIQHSPHLYPFAKWKKFEFYLSTSPDLILRILKDYLRDKNMKLSVGLIKII
jgi:hypothetical protein